MAPRVFRDQQRSGRRHAAPGALDQPEDEQEDEADGYPRRSSRKSIVFQSTRRQLRAVAPDGLLVEDVLRRLDFDEALLELQQGQGKLDIFTALIDHPDHTDESPPGSKLCRAFTWLGKCRFGDQCRHSHTGRKLKLWRPHTSEGTLFPPIGNRSAHLPMMEVSLDGIRKGMTQPQSLRFLLFDGFVVWGPDLGRLGAELWTSFVRYQHGLPISSGDSQILRDASDWTSVPSSLWQTVVTLLNSADLAALVGALPLGVVSWQDAANEQWPFMEESADACKNVSENILSDACTFMSLISASRSVAALLKVNSLNLLSSPSLGVSSEPSTPLQGPSLPPPAVALTTAPSSRAPSSCSRGLYAALESLPDPRCLRASAGVIPHGCLCVGSSLLVYMADGGDRGELRAVRRSDLRRVSGMKVKDGSCLDFQNELLLVGTHAPARLLAFDLTEAAPRSPKNQLRLYSAGRHAAAQVWQVAFLGSQTDCCVCGLTLSASSGLSEVLLVDCRQGSLAALRRLAEQPAACASGLASSVLGSDRCIYTDALGRLSIWDCSNESDAAGSSLTESLGRISFGNLLAGDIHGKWIAQTGREKHVDPIDLQPEIIERSEAHSNTTDDTAGLLSDAVSVTTRDPTSSASHDGNRCKSDCANAVDGSLLVFDMRQGRRELGWHALPLAPPMASDSDFLQTPPFIQHGWVVRQVLVEHPFVIVTSSPMFQLSAMYLHAFHLPSGRALARGHALPTHVTALACAGDGRLVFAGLTKHGEGFVQLPGQRSMAATSSEISAQPPWQTPKRVQRASDLRARGTRR
eukprot:TRINITY_DN34750_c0_g1_i1.p1 TRINITY_DN34750_c0_g1~~TRINITY_DN34750_c0_g1_i1.p1  ORF type:complete len:829 (-),score=95.51 TRINITY_DN34750_c0_g1_i1:26-2440(-)